MARPEETSEETNVTTHTRAHRERIDGLIDELQQSIAQVDEPQALALMETASEVLGGLRKAFAHYEEKEEAAWKPSDE